jgi:hypothetical protein
MQPAVCQVVTQQVVVHRVIKGHAEAKSFHVLRAFHALVFEVQRDRLPV